MDPAQAAGRAIALALFRKRNFTLLWLMQSVSVAARAMVQMAAGLYVFQRSGSALDVGLMLVATMAPGLLVGLFAGVVVDRANKRVVLVAVEVTRALLMLAVPLLLDQNVAWLFLVVFLTSAAGQFFAPAHASLIPDVVDEEELTVANSLFVISAFGANSLGFIAGGLGIGSWGAGLTFGLAAGLYLVSAMLALGLRVTFDRQEERTTLGAVTRNLADSLGAITQTPVLRALFLVFAPVFLVTGALYALILPFAVGSLNTSEAQYGLLEAVSYLGIALGGVLLTGMGGRLRDTQWLSLSLVLMGLVIALMAGLTSLPLVVVLYFLAGLVKSPSVMARNAVIQRNTPRMLRGRVYGAFFVMHDSLHMLGGLLAGVADLLGVRWMIALVGLVYVVSGVAAALLPGLRKAAPDYQRMQNLLLPTLVQQDGLSSGRPARAAELNLLTRVQPAVARMDDETRRRLIAHALVREAPASVHILREGDPSTAAYFILKGRAVAGVVDQGRPRLYEVMTAGDFFGEIAAMSGSRRTADVVADGAVSLLEIPAERLHDMAHDSELGRVFHAKMLTRLARTNTVPVGRFGDKDQDALLDLRTPQPAEATA